MPNAIISHAQLIENRTAKNANGCLEWQKGLSKSGYGTIKVDRKKWYTHRLAWTIIKGAIPNGLLVCHHCDNPKCLNIDHLFLGTNKSNMQDMSKKKRYPNRSGTKNPRTRLTDADVLAIRASSDRGTVLAKRYGVAPTTISHILTRRRWNHI